MSAPEILRLGKSQSGQVTMKIGNSPEFHADHQYLITMLNSVNAGTIQHATLVNAVNDLQPLEETIK